MRRAVKSKFHILLIGLLAVILIGSPVAVFAAKINSSPSSNISINKGQSRTVQLQLSQPIICPDPSGGCTVELTFASSDPSKATVSSLPVTWNYTDWAQSRTITIQTLDDGQHAGNQNLSVSATAVSNAPYYAGFQVTVPFTIVDAPVFTGSTSFTGSRDDTIPITDLQVTGAGNDVVHINLFVPSGSLTLGTTTGLTFEGQATGRNLNFSGTRTAVNNALTSLTFKPGKTATVALQATIDGLPNSVYDPGSHHLYQTVASEDYPTWDEANTAAQSTSLQAATGYLANITSEHEQDMVSRLNSDGWLGGSDSATEGEWQWTGGPESGQTFWSGDATTGSAVNNSYTHWTDGMPDNYTGSNSNGENCLQMYDSGSQGNRWNDQNCEARQSPNYISEYGDDTHPISLTYKDIDIHVTPGRDLNDDGTEDADQPHVADMQGVDGKWFAVAADYGCELTNTNVVAENTLATQDADYDYTNGLINFTGTCRSPGMNTSISIYYYDALIDDLQPRKYDPNTQTYTTLSDAVLEQRTINGHDVAVATYHMSDGSDLDTDNGTAGQFTDPIGFAQVPQITPVVVPAVAEQVTTSSDSTHLAGTGENRSVYIMLATLAIVLGFGLLTHKYSRDL